jgi:hypothetical protein
MGNWALAYNVPRMGAGERSAATLGVYLAEIGNFAAFMKPNTPPGARRREHFCAYMIHLLEKRKLGRHSRRRVYACF